MSMFSETVSRDLYDQALADRRRIEDRMIALAAESVPRSAYQAVVDQLAALTKEAMALKRHDLNMVPADFDPSASDPMKSLGPKAQLAIEEFAAGDAEMRKYLIGRAHMELAALRASISDDDDADAELAKMIQNGDR